jgi:chaperone required for assembly of F1-ATPase
MERFYEKVAAVKGDSGWGVALDGRAVKTPARKDLIVPHEIFAEAIVAEWQAQEDEIDPLAMGLTRLANTALDRTAGNRPQVIDEVAGYGKSDLLCYHTADPLGLVQLQLKHWQPILDWLAETHQAALTTTAEIAPVEQDIASLRAIFSAIAQHDDFVLTGLHAATAVCGSVALGLALLEGRIDVTETWSCALLDERYQAERWGVEADVESGWESVRLEISTAAEFMSLAQNQAG